MKIFRRHLEHYKSTKPLAEGPVWLNGCSGILIPGADARQSFSFHRKSPHPYTSGEVQATATTIRIADARSSEYSYMLELDHKDLLALEKWFQQYTIHPYRKMTAEDIGA